MLTRVELKSGERTEDSRAVAPATTQAPGPPLAATHDRLHAASVQTICRPTCVFARCKVGVKGMLETQAYGPSGPIALHRRNNSSEG